MKKFLIILSLILIIIIIVCFVGIKLNLNISNRIMQKNKEYEKYLSSNIYGTDVVSLINKAMNSNEENNVEKDEKGFYIDNKNNSIIINLVMITDEEKKETATYRMEAISKVGITEFIKNFNTEEFKCTKILYHKETGRISHIELSQQ